MHRVWMRYQWRNGKQKRLKSGNRRMNDPEKVVKQLEVISIRNGTVRVRWNTD